ncbi:MAG: hypothetical protein IKN65_07635 [Clostridia bacterium]|nr:hypothetical protein [Clostridia bacterium]
MENYFETIKNALIKADEADENWAWYPVKYNDDTIEFRWGYLDYLEENRNFVITVYNVEDDDIAVEILLPSGSSVFVLVGENFWDDRRTIEEGIELAIQDAVKYAKQIY